jgi:hypothetical protein
VKIPEPYRSLARKARDEGWTIAATRRGHLAWRSPSGALIITASTPSDGRAYRNTCADLKRAGLAA